MEIPGLRSALQIVLHDATERRRMWHSAEKISSQDGLSLINKMYRQRAAGIYVDKGNQAKLGYSKINIQSKVKFKLPKLPWLSFILSKIQKILPEFEK